MRTSVGLFEMVTACLATLVAGMSLMLPIDFAWTTESSALQLDLLAHSLPRAIAAGVVIALIIAVFATTVNHALAAWGSALGGISLILVTHLVGRSSGPGTSLATLNFLDSIAGGILLGGIAAAVLRGRLQVFGWTFGALGSLVVGAALPVPHANDVSDPTRYGRWPAIDSPPPWLILTTLALVALGLLANRHRAEVERRSVELPMAPILGGLVYIVVTLFGTEWLTRRADDRIDIALAAGATVIAGLIAAMLLPRRDGTLVLLAVALAAVGSAIMPSWLPVWSSAPLLVLLALGIVLGLRRPGPMFALIVLTVLVLYCLLALGHDSHDRVRNIVVGVVLALTAGYCFGSTSPRYNPTRVLGVAIVFMPSVVLALRDHVSRGDFTTVTVDAGRWYVCQVPTANSPTPYWTALGITVGCLAGLVALRRLRAPAVAPVTAPAEDETDS
ncbi:hypothetical protein BJY24_003109 [Nocardia transvalensis]|uniref:Uncharacterized protein n=1 Tax=Nocardia transvalensis TaxID=37333 RepID=A0A7W9PDQ9_9NOCA|nr:hypothetical protein [Nocardia transvalensis]MBB5914242.1 hypothetical protein [Nocardia transvalensis]